MASTFFGLNIAGSGLRAANANLNTTANNISNQETKGYSRQQVITEAANALRVFTSYGCAGAGVETLAVERTRDHFYDVKYWNNRTKLGVYEMKEYYQKQVEDYLSDDNKSGFKSLFNSMTNALYEVTKNPDSSPVKQTFVSSAKSMTEYFNNMAANLQGIQEDINDEIKNQVDRINSFAEEIATLSQQINVVRISGGNVNNLLDSREKIIDDLSKIVKVETTETPILDTSVEPPRETGGTRMVVKICGGLTLTDADVYHRLDCVARKNDEKVNQSDIDGLYDLVWENGNEFVLTNKSIGGTLQGLIEMRDGNNGEYFGGPEIKSSQIKDNGDGTHTVDVVVPEGSNLSFMSRCTLADSGIITVGTARFKFTDWTYDEASRTYSFVLDDKGTDAPMSNLAVGQSVEVGYEIEYEGIPYYMEQMNEWVRDFAKTCNAYMAGGVDADGNVQPGGYPSDAFESTSDHGPILFTGKVLTEYESQYAKGILQNTDTNSDGSAVSKGRGYYYLTAYNFAVNDVLNEDATRLSTKYTASDGVEQKDLVEDVIDMFSDKTKFRFRGSSAGEFLECILNDIALNSSNAQVFTKTYQGLEKTIENQRQSIMGVDTDEESVNLVKFQNAYNLASKMIQTFSEIYDRLITQTGV